MALTLIEQLLDDAVKANSTILPVNQSCDVLVTSGPTRLANQNPEALRALAATALNGFSRKDVTIGSIAAVPADLTVTAPADSKVIATLVTVAGSAYAFRRAPLKLTLAATGATTLSIVCYPKDTRAQFLVLSVTDNGNVGQVVASVQPILSWLVASHPGTAASEFSLSIESVNMRDFTNRVQ